MLSTGATIIAVVSVVTVVTMVTVVTLGNYLLSNLLAIFLSKSCVEMFDKLFCFQLEKLGLKLVCKPELTQ